MSIKKFIQKTLKTAVVDALPASKQLISLPKTGKKEAGIIAVLTSAKIIYTQYDAGGAEAVDVEILILFATSAYALIMRLYEKHNA